MLTDQYRNTLFWVTLHFYNKFIKINCTVLSSKLNFQISFCTYFFSIQKVKYIFRMCHDYYMFYPLIAFIQQPVCYCGLASNYRVRCCLGLLQNCYMESTSHEKKICHFGCSISLCMGSCLCYFEREGPAIEWRQLRDKVLHI